MLSVKGSCVIQLTWQLSRQCKVYHFTPPLNRFRGDIRRRIRRTNKSIVTQKRRYGGQQNDFTKKKPGRKDVYIKDAA